MTDWPQLEKMFEVAEKEFGEIDIVCPGAGVYEPVCTFGFGITSLAATFTNIWL